MYLFDVERLANQATHDCTEGLAKKAFGVRGTRSEIRQSPPNRYTPVLHAFLLGALTRRTRYCAAMAKAKATLRLPGLPSLKELFTCTATHLKLRLNPHPYS